MITTPRMFLMATLSQSAMGMKNFFNKFSIWGNGDNGITKPAPKEYRQYQIKVLCTSNPDDHKLGYGQMMLNNQKQNLEFSKNGGFICAHVKEASSSKDVYELHEITRVPSTYSKDVMNPYRYRIVASLPGKQQQFEQIMYLPEHQYSYRWRTECDKNLENMEAICNIMTHINRSLTHKENMAIVNRVFEEAVHLKDTRFDDITLARAGFVKSQDMVDAIDYLQNKAPTDFWRQLNIKSRNIVTNRVIAELNLGCLLNSY